MCVSPHAGLSDNMAIEHGGNRGIISSRLLQAFPSTSLERLQDHLEPVVFDQGTSIYHVGSPIRRLYFIERGFVSIVKTMQDGRTIEVGTKYNGDAVGLFGVYGIETSTWDSIVQVPVKAWRLDNEALRAEIQINPAVKKLLDRYTYLVLSGLTQTAACHRLHSLKQRFCRWLLLAQDGAQSGTLPLTHETLALMLGVQRSGVSIVASAFQKQGVLRNHRGRLTILERPVLEAEACECYETSSRAMDNLYAPRHGAKARGNTNPS